MMILSCNIFPLKRGSKPKRFNEYQRNYLSMTHLPKNTTPKNFIGIEEI